MKQYLSLILIISCFSLQTFSQTKKNGILHYYSKPIEDVKINKYALIINYITIDKNIKVIDPLDTSRKTPTLEEYMDFARSTPSYEFYVLKKSDTLFTIMYLQKNVGNKSTFYFEVFDLKKNNTELIESSVWGEITEKRVDEMMFNNYDARSKKGAIVGTNSRQFLFNKMIYGYQDYEKLKLEITELTKRLIK